MASGITAREPEQGTTLPPAPAVGELSPGEGKAWELNYRKHLKAPVCNNTQVQCHRTQKDGSLGLCYTLQSNTKVEEKPLLSRGLLCTPGNTSAPGPASTVSFWGLRDIANLEELQAQPCRARNSAICIHDSAYRQNWPGVKHTHTHSYMLRTVKGFKSKITQKHTFKEKPSVFPTLLSPSLPARRHTTQCQKRPSAGGT